MTGPELTLRGSSQCTYRCVVLPDCPTISRLPTSKGLNAPTGAWCSLTFNLWRLGISKIESQCTYRCVVLPDSLTAAAAARHAIAIKSQCTYRCVVLPDCYQLSAWGCRVCLNAPTGAWCSLTGHE